MSSISFIEKYALIYYTPLLQHFISVTILLYTSDVKLFSAINTFLIICSYYIPIEDKQNTQFSLSLNKTKWALIPLILNCLSTPIVLYLVWQNYDQFTSTTSDWVIALLSVSILLGTSIDASH